MYGYIVPDKSALRASDFVLYRSFYCGLCCETGRFYGQLPRFTTNYDFAFFAALLFDVTQSDVVIEEHGCVLNPKKKAILQHNALLERITAANIIVSYFKASDGVEDGDGLKYRLVKHALKKPAEKARAVCPEVWDGMSAYIKEQRRIESNHTSGLDRAADAFACFMRSLPELVTGVKTDDKLGGLCYNIGKFVYLADALDDIKDDFKAKRYNPFLATFGDFTDRKSFIAANRQAIEQCFNGICGRAAQCLYGLRFTQSGELISNIVLKGIRKKTAELLGSSKKLKAPRI